MPASPKPAKTKIKSPPPDAVATSSSSFSIISPPMSASKDSSKRKEITPPVFSPNMRRRPYSPGGSGGGSSTGVHTEQQGDVDTSDDEEQKIHQTPRGWFRRWLKAPRLVGRKTFIKVKGGRQLAIWLAVIATLLIAFLWLYLWIYGRMKAKLEYTTWQLMESSLDHTVHECDDFYNHTCGNIRKSLVKNGWKWVAEAAYRYNLHLMRRALEDGGRSALYHYSKSVVMAKFIEYYAWCLDGYPTTVDDFADEYLGGGGAAVTPSGKVDEEQEEVIKRLGVPVARYRRNLQHMLGAPWPLLKKQNDLAPPLPPQVDRLTAGWFIDTYVEMFMAGLHPVFRISITSKPNGVKFVTFTPSMADEANDSTMAKVMTVMNVKPDDDYKEVIGEIKRLHEYFKTIKRGPARLMSLAEFRKRTGSCLDWVVLLNAIFLQAKAKSKFTDKTFVMVNGLEYFAKVAMVVTGTGGPGTGRELKNYLGWSYVYHRSTRVHLKVDNIVHHHDHHPKCLREASEEFKNAATRLFLDQLILDQGKAQVEKTRARVTDMMIHLKAAFHDILAESTWLDRATRAHAIEKLEMMRELIGYEDWMLNDDLLDAEYEAAHAPAHDRGAMLRSYHRWVRHTVGVAMRAYDQPAADSKQQAKPQEVGINREIPVVGDLKWSSVLTEVNAEYSREDNAMFIFMGYLQKPYFDLADPDAINYGNVGNVIGHEMTHGFDEIGAEYDKDGILRNWWSADTKGRFTHRAECFVHQYSNITEPVTKMKLNGKNTLDENIADNGGIKQAYRAFLRHQNEHSKRSLMKPSEYGHHTDEQLFFYSYAMSWCEAQMSDEIESSIQSDLHALNKYRVNVVLQNFPPFSKAFNCPAGSPMNPQHKCAVW